MDFTLFLNHAFYVLLLSIILSLITFPFVFLMSFFYESASEKYPKVPKIVFQFLFTFLACLLAVFALEVYLGFTLPSALS